MMIIHTLLPLLLASLSTLVAAWDKPTLFPDPDGLSVLDAGFRRMIPAPGVRYLNTKGWKVRMPRACAEEGESIQESGKMRCPLWNMDVFTVHYADVPDDVAWLFCRCRDADYSQQTMIDEFGRLPIAIRQRVRYVMSFKGLKFAGTSNNDLMLQEISPTVMLHEAAHCFDDNGSKSGTANYDSAIAKDTCWADGYAQHQGENNNRADPWAQVLILRLYQTLVGPLPNVKDNDLECLWNQLKVVSQQTDDLIRAGQSGKFDYSKKRDYGEIGLRTDYATGFPNIGANSDIASKMRKTEKAVTQDKSSVAPKKRMVGDSISRLWQA